MDLGSAASRAWWLAKGPGRAARRRSQNVDYLAEWAEFEVKLVTRAPVIIYSMGKSGTTSLTVALREAGFPVVKAHSLTKGDRGGHLGAQSLLRASAPTLLLAVRLLAARPARPSLGAASDAEPRA